MQNCTYVRLARPPHFLATARLGSLTAAATELGVDHATMGRRVARLESAIGRKLITRLPRSTRLTEDGVALVAAASSLEDGAAAVIRHLRGRPPELSGSVTVSALPGVAAFLIAPSLPVFTQKHPGIRLVLTATSIVASLERGEADIAIGFVRPRLPGRVVRRVGELSFALYGSADLADQPPGNWAFIGFEASLEDIPQQRWLRAFAAGRPFSLRSNDVVTQMQGARAGAGVALLPCLAGDAAADLVRLTGQPAPASRPLWMSVHADVRRSPAVRAVMDYLADLCAAKLGSSDREP